MKTLVVVVFVLTVFASCDDHDTYTWDAHPVKAPDQMADTNQYIDVNQWKPEDRTANAAYYAKQKERVAAHMKSNPQSR